MQLEWTGGGLASTTLNLARWGRAVYCGKAFGGYPSLPACFRDRGSSAGLQFNTDRIPNAAGSLQAFAGPCATILSER